ncbi:cell division protein FtsQ/DivIB [Luteimicrobium subarcticum]|uniref:cell division protein FtsQ/DivIB n=1 Tax=Luteimicrobium subarcticum TaxID=620910 RepID=UPI0012FE3C59|nr:FtsQ-type POTRA domain-containing protein [Luteimicrobium subarcticum]
MTPPDAPDAPDAGTSDDHHVADVADRGATEVAGRAVSAPPTAPTVRLPSVPGPSVPGSSVRTASRPSTGAVPAVRRVPVVSTGMVDRLAERDAMRRHRRRRRLAVGASVSVLVGVLVWVLFFSPLLAAQASQVRVVGAGDLVDSARVEQIVGGAAGTPLPRLDTVAMREHLLDVPGVKDVAIVREWPRGLTVRITPRDPVAAVPDGSRYALLDVDATTIAEVSVPPAGVPVVRVPLGESSRPALDAVLTVVGALPESLSGEVVGASATTQDTVTLMLRGGQSVVWGSAQDSPLKVRVLTALRAAPQSRHAKVFDVSAPDLPVTR